MAAVKPVMHDEEFYFQDIVIQVENRLFKVPRRVFIQESQVFRDMFSLPVPEGILADGTSDSKPLSLDGIMAIDFVRLLRFLFPAKQLYPLKSLDEWTSVFKLAALWDMGDVMAEAIQNMTPLLEKQPAKQIKLSLEHGVAEWLVPGLNRLVQRAEPLNKEDVDLIGLDYALQIMTLREDCRYSSSSWSIQRRGEVPLDFAKEIQIRFNIRQ